MTCDDTYCIDRVKISTHTLTWSVTFRYVELNESAYISTHTLTWSVTDIEEYELYTEKFQLTRSRGA